MLSELAHIESTVNAMKPAFQQGEAAFEFVRLQALLCKAKARSEAVQQQLLPRIQHLYSRLEMHRTHYDQSAEKQLKRIERDYPNMLDQANNLRGEGRYHALTELLASLQKDSEKTIQPFQDLISHIDSFDVSALEKASLGLDALLFDDSEVGEQDAEAGSKTSSDVGKIKARAKELRSLQHYRERLGKVITENMVRQVIQEDPDNAGPLNPQRLLVRTIGAMKDISPAYVNRLVPYYDSLLWLEQAGSLLDGEATTAKVGSSKAK